MTPDTNINELFLIRRDNLSNDHAPKPFFAHIVNVTYMPLHPPLSDELPVIPQVLDLTSSPL